MSSNILMPFVTGQSTCIEYTFQRYMYILHVHLEYSRLVLCCYDSETINVLNYHKYRIHYLRLNSKCIKTDAPLIHNAGCLRITFMKYYFNGVENNTTNTKEPFPSFNENKFLIRVETIRMLCSHDKHHV
jgi:hypothetical protein